MKLYFAHSRAFDFTADYYAPIKASSLAANNELIFPHDGPFFPSKDVIGQCDALVAEVSHHSTGMGIELGWADMQGIPIIAVYRSDSTPSPSIQGVAAAFLPYSSQGDMVRVIQEALRAL